MGIAVSEWHLLRSHSHRTQSNTSKHLRRSNRLHTHDDTSPHFKAALSHAHMHTGWPHIDSSRSALLAACLPLCMCACLLSRSRNLPCFCGCARFVEMHRRRKRSNESYSFHSTLDNVSLYRITWLYVHLCARQTPSYNAFHFSVFIELTH